MKIVLKRCTALLLILTILCAWICFDIPMASAAVDADASKDGNLRVLITSDIHHTPGGNYYGVSTQERLQLWVDSVNAEHDREPLDLIIVNGDISLDHYYNTGGGNAGTYMGTDKVSYTEKFMKEYVSQLPEGVPYYIMAGNHEQYNNEQWKGYTGNDRQCYVSMEGNLFILVDNFGNFLEPNATENAQNTPSNVAYIKEIMDMYPDDNVWLISHYFNPNGESSEFSELVKNTDRIIGLFGGHNHMNNVTYTAKWGNKPYAMTGTFARSGIVNSSNTEGLPQRFGYTPKELTETQEAYRQANLASFWGFRELVISPTSAYSNYIGVDTGSTAPYYYGHKITLERRISDSVTYTLPEVGPTENWGPAADGIYYIGSPNDMLAFGLAAQTDAFAEKTVKLVRDIDMVGVNWTMIPTFSGTFDGNGHEIRNFCLYGETANLAMIKSLKNGKICNLRMVDGIVQSVGVNTTAVFAAYVTEAGYFENVYTRMKVATDASHYRAGGFVGNIDQSTAYFDRCVSECTFEGMRAGGFIAQINTNAKVVMTDCAFIGDMSAAGKWSSGLSGLTVGHLDATRCVSLGKPSANAESGALVFLDHQNQTTSFVADINLVDCFAAVDTARAIGAQSARSFRFNFHMSYADGTSYTLETASNNTLAANLTNVEDAFVYLTKGSETYLTANNFRTLCPGLTQWSVADGTVSYANGKSVIKILPTDVAN